MFNTPRGQTAPSQGLREVAQPSPTSQMSLVSCHAPSLSVPQWVGGKRASGSCNVPQALDRLLARSSELLQVWPAHQKRCSSSKGCHRTVSLASLLLKVGCPLDVAKVMLTDWARHCTPISVLKNGSPCCGELNSSLLHMVSSLAIFGREMVSGRPLGTTRLNCKSLEQALTVLGAPVQLISGPGNLMFLRRTLT